MVGNLLSRSQGKGPCCFSITLVKRKQKVPPKFPAILRWKKPTSNQLQPKRDLISPGNGKVQGWIMLNQRQVFNKFIRYLFLPLLSPLHSGWFHHHSDFPEGKAKCQQLEVYKCKAFQEQNTCIPIAPESCISLALVVSRASLWTYWFGSDGPACVSCPPPQWDLRTHQRSCPARTES